MVNVKQARIGVSMSQSEMAKAIGCSVGTYRKWESDPGEMPLKFAKKFCDIVKLSWNEISFV